jgi:competence protein ComEA
MDQTSPSTPVVTGPQSDASTGIATGHGPVQVATGVLFASALVLLLIHSVGYLRTGSRPSTLVHRGEIGYQIDLNQAERAELLQIPGIGENLARRIIDHRQENGPFQSVEDLRAVRGIGPMTLERIRAWVRVNNAAMHRENRQEESADLSVSRRISPGTSKPQSSGRPIDINRASAAQLQGLPSIGPKKSELIVAERKNGPFKSVDDLRRVPGIGPKTLQRLRPHVTVENSSLRTVAAAQNETVED